MAEIVAKKKRISKQKKSSKWEKGENEMQSYVILLQKGFPLCMRMLCIGFYSMDDDNEKDFFFWRRERDVSPLVRCKYNRFLLRPHF